MIMQSLKQQNKVAGTTKTFDRKRVAYKKTERKKERKKEEKEKEKEKEKEREKERKSTLKTAERTRSHSYAQRSIV
jgi:hypothetical protein